MLRTEKPHYQKVLSEELARRVELNPRFSLRGFARLLGISPGSLSQILKGDRSISDRLVSRIFTALELGEAERQAFIVSLVNDKKKSGKKRISKSLREKSAYVPVRSTLVSESGQGVRDIGLDEFRIIADWYHYAILVMVEREDFVGDPRVIAKRLGISLVEAKLAFERLQSMELIEFVDERWRKTDVRLQTKDLSKTSESHKRRQRQIMDRARQSLDLIPVDQRHHAAITINVDPSRIPELKEKIQALLWGMASQIEGAGTPNKVYEVALQIFPLEKIEGKEKS